MNINPNQIQKMMKQMGMQQEEIDAEYVIIKTAEHQIVINNPQVSKVDAMGQKTYQIVGEEEIVANDEEGEEKIVEITEDDLNVVIQQTGANQDDALYALQESNGDIAEAIVKLSEKK